MFGTHGRRHVWAACLTLSTAAVVGCSSDPSGSSEPDPFDSGTVVVPEAGATESPTVQIQVQGQGTVESSDVHLVDGGPVGQVICTSAGGAACAAARHTTLYALPASGWKVSEWTAQGGFDSGLGLPNVTSDYQVDLSSPNPLVVVFIPIEPDGGS
jgi:hypothetical protein